MIIKSEKKKTPISKKSIESAVKQFESLSNEYDEKLNCIRQNLMIERKFEINNLRKEYCAIAAKKALEKLYAVDDQILEKTLNKIKTKFATEIAESEYIEIPEKHFKIYRKVFWRSKLKPSEILRGGIRIIGKKNDIEATFEQLLINALENGLDTKIYENYFTI
jgi:hypothetical protein